MHFGVRHKIVSVLMWEFAEDLEADIPDGKPFYIIKAVALGEGCYISGDDCHDDFGFVTREDIFNAFYSKDAACVAAQAMSEGSEDGSELIIVVEVKFAVKNLRRHDASREVVGAFVRGRKI